LEKWFALSADALAARGKDVAELKAQLGRLRAVEPTLAELCTRLAHHFAKAARG
jgi:GMP synthase (glutamine-hydrolysing)